MGMQDRDYYKEWWAKREGYVEKARFRLPARGMSGVNLPGKPLPSKRNSDWHWSLQLLLMFVICAAVFAFFKLLKIYTG